LLLLASPSVGRHQVSRDIKSLEVDLPGLKGNTSCLKTDVVILKADTAIGYIDIAEVKATVMK
jgi:hypothetical protein